MSPPGRILGQTGVVPCEVTAAGDAAHLAERIGSDLPLPFEIADGVVCIEAASAGDRVDDSDVLLAHADRRMYERKRGHRVGENEVSTVAVRAACQQAPE